ncbi:MAG: A24 family peptidase [Betaproteobacteria bacterium]|nr:A24 family peptidase [Betaproteobacteria bacterium]
MTYYAAAFVLGSILGSFTNVVIYRLPEIAAAGIRPDATRSLLFLAAPLSFCPNCNTPIRPWYNIPIVSYLWLRGKANCCGHPISIRYPIVELLGAMIVMLCYWRFGLSWPAAAAVIMCFLLLVVSWIDWQTYRLPDILVNLLLWGGLFVNLSGQFAPLPEAVQAAFVGYLGMQLFATGGRLVIGKQILGEGDPKLVAAIGTWLGLVPMAFVVVIGCALGSVWGMAVWLTRGRRKRDLFLPLGPFLSLAAILMLMAGDAITSLYLDLGQ